MKQMYFSTAYHLSITSLTGSSSLQTSQPAYNSVLSSKASAGFLDTPITTIGQTSL